MVLISYFFFFFLLLVVELVFNTESVQIMDKSAKIFFFPTPKTLVRMEYSLQTTVSGRTS